MPNPAMHLVRGEVRASATPDFGRDPLTTVGLTYGYQSGVMLKPDGTYELVGGGTLALAAGVVNYVERDDDGVVTVNQTGFSAFGTPMARAETDMAGIIHFQDFRETAINRSRGLPGGYTVRVGEVGVDSILYPWGDARRYGVKADGANDDTAGAQNAVLSAQALGLGNVVLPPGTVILSNTVTVSGSGLKIRGAGLDATTVRFTKGGGGIAFDFNAGALSLWYCGIGGMRFTSPDTVNQKTMIRVCDVRHFDAPDIGSGEGDWVGAGSIGIDVMGRELVRVRRPYIYADFPIRYRLNPNLATNSIDHSSVVGGALVVTAGLANYGITFDPNIIVSRWKVERIAFVRGAGCIYLPSTGALPSIGLGAISCRHEQGVVGSTYQYHFEGTVGEIQLLSIKDCDFSGQSNGIKLRGVRLAKLENLLIGKPGGTPLDFDGSCTAITMENVYWEAGSTPVGFGAVNGLTMHGCQNGSATKIDELALALSNGINNEVVLPEPGSVYAVTGPTASFSITGLKDITPGGNRPGRKVTLVNITAQTMTLKHNDAGSAFGVRFAIGGAADLPISPNGAVDLVYLWTGGVFAWYVTGVKA